MMGLHKPASMANVASATLLTLAVLLTPPTSAEAQAQGRVTVTDARIAPPPPGAPTAAGYLTLTNLGRAPDRLVAVSSPGAAAVQLHSMTMAGGIMRMRPVAGGLALPPGRPVTLSPMSLHLMFVSPTRPLREGGRVPATLRFQRAPPMRVVFRVAPERPGAMPGMTMSGR